MLAACEPSQLQIQRFLSNPEGIGVYSKMGQSGILPGLPAFFPSSLPLFFTFFLPFEFFYRKVSLLHVVFTRDELVRFTSMFWVEPGESISEQPSEK